MPEFKSQQAGFQDEQAVRREAYQAARKAGKSGQEAANAAKRAAEEFKRTGAAPSSDLRFGQDANRAAQDYLAKSRGTTRAAATPGTALSADDLVNRILLTAKSDAERTQMQQQSWWRDNPNKQEAYRQIVDIQSSPQKLADYVASRGLTDLQRYDWWNASPHKQQAWDLMSVYRTGEQPFGSQPGAVPGAEPTGAAPGTSEVTGEEPAFNADAATQAAIDALYADPRIPDDVKPLFERVVRGWDVDKDLNINNVLNEFNKIKEETIDPFFAEQTEQFVNDLKSTVQFQAQQREQELEQERTVAGQRIRQTREGLEKAGLTFTGKAIEELGAESAFAQPGTPQAAGAATPLQTPFGGDLFYEGTVNQASRLLSSSSALRYQKNLEALARQTEQALGSAQAQQLQVPGLQFQGDVSQGAIEAQKQQKLASTLGSVYQQGQQQRQAQQPVQVFQ